MTLVLLLGTASHGLAGRLEASGYATLSWTVADLALAPNLTSLRLQPPGVAVLTDDSTAAIKVLRQDLPEVPQLLDIGSDSVEGRSHCLSVGADDFWLSSAPPSDLLQRLRLHLRVSARRQGTTPGLRLADLTLEPDTRRARRGPRQLALTAREYGLLLHLLRHQGQVLSREEILSVVWKGQQGVASNVVEVYVRYLRQTLEEGGARRLLHTVRGRGYSLSDGAPRLAPPSP